MHLLYLFGQVFAVSFGFLFALFLVLMLVMWAGRSGPPKDDGKHLTFKERE